MDVPSFRLDGRVAFVSGAGGHLGSAISRALAAAGAHVLLNGRRREPLQALCDDLAAAGHAAEVLAFDVTDAESLRRELGRLERLDLLVNNAHAGRTARWEAATAEDFRQAYEVGVVAAQQAMLAAQPALERAAALAGHASIVNIASMYGVVSPDPRVYGDTGHDSPPFYGAAKAALLQLTRHGACALGPRGIRVNAVTPGPFPRPQAQEKFPELMGRLAAKTALGRLGRAEELAGIVAFLASDAAGYITGATIPVDGGWTAW